MVYNVDIDFILDSLADISVYSGFDYSYLGTLSYDCFIFHYAISATQ